MFGDESAYVPLEDLEIDDKLNYVEKPVAILDRKVKHLRNKSLNQMEVPVGEHLRLDKYDSTMVDSQSQRCWQLSRWKYRWVNILDLINMTPQWWIARGAGNCLDGSTGGEHLRLDKYDSTMVDSQRCWQLSRWKYRWVNILDLINMTPQWWIARGAGNCLDESTGQDRYALGDQIGHVVKQNQTLCKELLDKRRIVSDDVSYHSSIGMPPYEILYGRKCRTPVLRRSWKAREVKPRFIRPFKIIARIGDVAYRLELPEELNGI
ncbi:hypothetical protein E3N88_25190 [Mikania micrantha]|uniref:Tf2-1-like SH3-like domain-containing protein n=1 Tax=Mikania micrantha TaxID=192012 RepID=A0A5N6N517_9ASTR|nr:hypothetical protein E3N88_25190 [Mikania micrantha]